MRTITFNELRKIKDSLPSGSMHRIADELGLHVALAAQKKEEAEKRQLSLGFDEL